MQAHIDRVLIDRRAIADRVKALARRIADDVAETGDGGELTIVPIMTGGLIFAADLIRELPLKLRMRLITVSSYRGATTRSMGARLEGQLPEELTGAHVLVIDDILDSGRTIQLVRELIGRRRPASLRVCMFLRKRIESAMRVAVDYVGFDIDDEFVVGYGLDYDGYYRNLPDVVTLKTEVTG